MKLLGTVCKSTGGNSVPPLLIIAGEPGVGKTTLATHFPDHLILDTERKVKQLKGLDKERTYLEIERWEDIINLMRELLEAAKAGSTEYKTLIVDTIDHAEHLLHAHLCEREGVNTIDDVGGGYGKGYNEALKLWQKFVKGTELLRKEGITCVLLAHTHVKTFKNPRGEDYDKTVLKMNGKAASYLREKCDAMAFAHHRDFATKKNPKNGMEKAKAITTGERVLSFKYEPAYESKQGFGLPDELPLDYEALKEALEAA